MADRWVMLARSDFTTRVLADATLVGVTARVLTESRGTLSVLAHLAGAPRDFLAQATVVGGRELELWRVACTIPLGAGDQERLIREPTTALAVREIGRLLRWWVGAWRPGAALPALPPASDQSGAVMATPSEREIEQDVIREAAHAVGRRALARLGTTQIEVAIARLRERGLTVTDADSLEQACDGLQALLTRGVPFDGDVTTTLADSLSVSLEWLLTGVATSPEDPRL